MAENYIVINGKRAELTEEQLKQLGIEVPKANPFAKVKEGEWYYSMLTTGEVTKFKSVGFDIEDALHNVANYCTDKEMMEQRALHETLNRLLWCYSMCHKTKNDSDKKYAIRRYKDKFDASWDFKVYTFIGEVTFDTYEIAQNAIKEIVEPFMKAHPEFKW